MQKNLVNKEHEPKLELEMWAARKGSEEVGRRRGWWGRRWEESRQRLRTTLCRQWRSTQGLRGKQNNGFENGPEDQEITSGGRPGGCPSSLDDRWRKK